jgi:fumarate hydratase subunit beta
LIYNVFPYSACFVLVLNDNDLITYTNDEFNTKWFKFSFNIYIEKGGSLQKIKNFTVRNYAPLSDEVAKELKSGDYVYITGTIYTARDAAHKRMWEALEKGEELPIEMKNNIIYYMGPSPAREGRPIGSAGPTTASRMDKYAPKLLDLGLKGMIGKGKRSEQVKEAIVRNGSVYFAAVGGAGAILSKAIKKSEVIAYDDLGTEAIRKLYVEDFPAIVVIDSQGNNLYETAIKEYAKQ